MGWCGAGCMTLHVSRTRRRRATWRVVQLAPGRQISFDDRSIFGWFCGGAYAVVVGLCSGACAFQVCRWLGISAYASCTRCLPAYAGRHQVVLRRAREACCGFLWSWQRGV